MGKKQSNIKDSVVYQVVTEYASANAERREADGKKKTATIRLEKSVSSRNNPVNVIKDVIDTINYVKAQHAEKGEKIPLETRAALSYVKRQVDGLIYKTVTGDNKISTTKAADKVRSYRKAHKDSTVNWTRLDDVSDTFVEKITDDFQRIASAGELVGVSTKSGCESCASKQRIIDRLNARIAELESAIMELTETETGKLAIAK